MKIIMIHKRKKSAQLLTKIFSQLADLKKHLRVKAWHSLLAKKTLPWYLLLSPDDAATKTWLEHTGEKFTWRSQINEYNDRVPNVNLYVTAKRVLIEPPAHFWQNPGAKTLKTLNRWQSFCRLLRRERWLQPLNGIIILADFKLLQEEASRQEYLQKLTQVLPDLAEVSLSRIPLYFFVSGLAQLTGFNAYINKLRPEQKDQIFGITFKQPKNQGVNLDQFPELFKDLLHRLDEKLLHQLPRDQDAVTNSEVAHFPLAFAEQQKNLQTLLSESAYAGSLKNKLLVRGIYFTAEENFARAPLEEVIAKEALLGSSWQGLMAWCVAHKKRVALIAGLTTITFSSVWLIGTLQVETYLNKVSIGLETYESLPKNSLASFAQLQALANLRHEHYRYFFRYLGIFFPARVDEALRQLALLHGQKVSVNFSMQNFTHINDALLTLNDFNEPNGAWQTFVSQVLKDQHAQNLANLRNYLDNPQNQAAIINTTQNMAKILAQANSSDAKVVLSTQLLSHQVAAFNQLQALAQTAPEPLKSWLRQLLVNTTLVVFGDTQSVLVNTWNSNVSNRCKQLIGNGFPIVANSERDIDMNNFTQMFRPGGVASNFGNAHVNALLSALMRSNTVYGARFNLPLWLQKNINSITLIQNAFFAAGSEPSLNMQWTPLYLSKNLAQFDISFGAQNLMYQNGPRLSQNIRWPGNASTINVKFVSLNGRELTQSYQGTWVLMRLLQSSEVKRVGPNNYQVTFVSGGFGATYQVKLNGGDFAGVMALLRFTCN